MDEHSKLQLLALGGHRMVEKKKLELKRESQLLNTQALSVKESNFSYPHDLSESIDEDIGVTNRIKESQQTKGSPMR